MFKESVIKTTEEVTTLRKQILVVNIKCMIREQDRLELIENIKKQMKDGLVVLPVGVEGFSVDADYLVLK